MVAFPRDENRVPVIGGVSSVDDETPTALQVNPTTGALLVETGSSTTTIKSFEVNEIEETGSLTYFGLETADGTWCIKKIDETSGTVFSYATDVNNTVTPNTYSQAWTDRASLTYGDYSGAF